MSVKQLKDIVTDRISPRAARGRRSLITDILSVQFLITGGITLIAMVGLMWTSGAVIENNVRYWAEQWAGELNEMGAPFYLKERPHAVLDVERFVQKYPEIESVTWYRPDGSVYASIDKNGPIEKSAAALEARNAAELSAKAGASSAYILEQNLEGNRRFRLSAPVWTESFGNEGALDFDPNRSTTDRQLLGFVAVNLDFSSYQAAFLDRLKLACVA